METWDAIRSRRDVRDYTAEPLPDEALQRIVEAGRRAPSANNWQPWDFVVVTDRPQLEQLSQVWQGGAHIARAAAAIGLVIDDYEPGRDRELALYDLGQVSLQMMVTAADLGIGSGHSAVGDQTLARQILGLPQTKILKYVIDFGYPAGRPLQPIKKPNRRPFDEVVHRGRW
jgi:nitroreductase